MNGLLVELEACQQLLSWMQRLQPRPYPPSEKEEREKQGSWQRNGKQRIADKSRSRASPQVTAIVLCRLLCLFPDKQISTTLAPLPTLNSSSANLSKWRAQGRKDCFRHSIFHTFSTINNIRETKKIQLFEKH